MTFARFDGINGLVEFIDTLASNNRKLGGSKKYQEQNRWEASAYEFISSMIKKSNLAQAKFVESDVDLERIILQLQQVKSTINDLEHVINIISSDIDTNIYMVEQLRENS